VANPTIFILSNRGFLIAVQMLPQNLVRILPNCCAKRLPARLLSQQAVLDLPPAQQRQPSASGEFTIDDSVSGSAVRD